MPGRVVLDRVPEEDLLLVVGADQVPLLDGAEVHVQDGRLVVARPSQDLVGRRG